MNKLILTLIVLLISVSQQTVINREQFKIKLFKEYDYQLVCIFSNDIELINCLLDLNPAVTSLSLQQESYSQPDISSLKQFLPKQKQLTALSLNFFDVQDITPLYTCLEGLSNINHLDINFQRFQKFNIYKLPQMFTDQYQSLVNFSLNVNSITTDYTPIVEVITQTENIVNLVLKTTPETYGVRNPVINNLNAIQDGLFKNCHSLINLEYEFLNTDWSQEQMDSFGQVFQGLNTIEFLDLNLNNNQIKDASFIENVFEPLNQLQKLLFDFNTNPVKSFEPLKNAFDKQFKLTFLLFITGYDSISSQVDFTPPQSYFKSMNSLFAGLSNLETLIFSLQDLNTENLDFADLQSIFGTSSLLNLEVQFYFTDINSLENFENVTQGLSNLNNLSLDFNLNSIGSGQIQYLNKAFKNIPNLNDLRFNFYFNVITNIDDLQQTLQGLSNLKHLNMDFTTQLKDLNQVQGFQNAFNDLQSLESLVLNFFNNKITTLEPLKNGLKNLTNLKKLGLNFEQNCLTQDSEYYQQQINDILPNLSNFNSNFENQGIYCSQQNFTE